MDRLRENRARLRLCGLFAAVSLMMAESASASTVVSCSSSATGGDHVDRGIVVPAYAGTNVRLVQLSYSGGAGTYRVTLTLRRGSFDGPIVGSPATAYVTLADVTSRRPSILPERRSLRAMRSR